ncbi:MAG: hypothetical protein II604_00475 [Bacteroidales bacterium]|nr:hypothetical protein [Bacteroidales bacterium]
MKEFRLNRIEIRDFKAQNRAVDFFDKTKITGRNASGKTTIVSAFSWLLTGLCDANTNKNADLFDNRFELTPETPKASVKAYISIDGEPHTIERTAKAGFSKERGTDKPKKKQSDDYAFIIDDIEVQASRFNEWIESNIAPVDVLKYCVNGEFFSNLVEDDWQKARVLLLSLVGEIKESDFTGDYSLIAQSLKDFSINEIKERSNKRITEYDTSIENANAEISANQSKIAEYMMIDYEGIEKNIAADENEIKEIDTAMQSGADSLAPFVEKQTAAINKKRELQTQLDDARLSYNREQKSKEDDIRAKIQRINKENDDIKARNQQRERQHNSNVQRKAYLLKEKENLQKETDGLRAKLAEVKSRVYNAEKCSFCGQTLPEDMLEKGREKFNAENEAEKKSIVAKGKANNLRVEQIDTELAELEKVIAAGYETEKEVSRAELDDQLLQLQKSFVIFEQTHTYKDKKAEIDAVVIPELPKIDNSANTARKQELIAEIKQLSSKLGFSNEIKRLREKNDELQNNIRDFCDKSSKEKLIIDKCRERQQEIAFITSRRINGRMKNTVIAMERQQKDGQAVPCCEITQANGTRFSTSNGAARINMRVDIQAMFCEHFGVTMPVFVDECSILDVCNLPVVADHQMVYLYNTNDSFKVEEM